MNILLVDDDDDDYEIFCEGMSKYDPKSQCLRAKDGLEALRYLTKQAIVQPDYIFLDINMPKMDGSEFIIEIKKHRTIRDIPIVIYSTTSNPREVKKFLALGATKFIVKPFHFAELMQSLRETLPPAK